MTAPPSIQVWSKRLTACSLISLVRLGIPASTCPITTRSAARTSAWRRLAMQSASGVPLAEVLTFPEASEPT